MTPTTLPAASRGKKCGCAIDPTERAQVRQPLPRAEYRPASRRRSSRRIFGV